MRYLRRALVSAMLAAGLAGPAACQEFLHFEGYWSAFAAKPGSIALAGRGLVTAIYPPLTTNFVASEYTWVMGGLLPTGTSVEDSIQVTTYDVGAATFTVYEDAGQNARQTFYYCPSNITGTDVRYGDGTAYLVGTVVSFQNTLDLHQASQGHGTWKVSVHWTGGSHLAEVPAAKRTCESSSTSTRTFACIPAGYSDAVTGRFFPLAGPAQPKSWGELKERYQ